MVIGLTFIDALQPLIPQIINGVLNHGRPAFHTRGIALIKREAAMAAIKQASPQGLLQQE